MAKEEEKITEKEGFGQKTKDAFGMFGEWSQSRKERKRELSEQATQRQKEMEAQHVFEEGLASAKDLIAPPAIEIGFDYLRLGEKFCRTLFVYTYPRYIFTNWLSPIINMDITMDIGMFIYPIESREIVERLKKKVGQIEATMMIAAEKGKIQDIELKTALQDAEEMRERIQKGEERFFQYSLYFTFYADTKEELEKVNKRIESVLGAKLIYTKRAILQSEQGFNSTLPIGSDQLYITRNMDTSSLSTTFPFTSTELMNEDGIFYGINRHNNSLIIFDRFSLENYNSVIFAKAGAGKSYATKLEILRSLMTGTDVFVIDPENEYQVICNAVRGSFLDVSLKSDRRINPFDLPKVVEEEEKENVLQTSIIALSGLIKLMIGPLSPQEDALLDKALAETYALKDITNDPTTHGNPPPIMSDLGDVLSSMEGAENMAAKLEKYTKGTFAGVFNQPTNIDLDNQFVVFSLRDLEESLRPIAMYIILNHIWNEVKKERKKRIMVVDEAWLLMQNEDSAKFMYGLAKRARKYYLGLTTITQDVEDFLSSQYGKAIVNNSSIQLLLKQSPAAIDLLADVFKLTEGEKQLLLTAAVGEGIFFAGQNHVAIKAYASYDEDQLVTSDPRQLEIIEEEKEKLEEGEFDEITDEDIETKEEPEAVEPS